MEFFIPAIPQRSVVVEAKHSQILNTQRQSRADTASVREPAAQASTNVCYLKKEHHPSHTLSTRTNPGETTFDRWK